MSATRILIRQGTITYRFMLFEARGDGSLLVFLDREARSQRGGYTTDAMGAFIPEPIADDSRLPSAKFSIHSTGVVHAYTGGNRKGTIYIEPLDRLTKVSCVGFVSIPRVSRLDLFDEKRHRHDASALLEIPEGVLDRLSFVIEIGPTPQQPKTYGAAIHYEIYSVIVRIEQNLNLNLPAELHDHFIHGRPSAGHFQTQQVDEATAELAFHRRVHERDGIIFREKSGAYVVLAAVPMRTVPKLTVTFNREDLYIEQVAFGKLRQPTHKVRFWICEKRGKNKTDDLRTHITSVTLDAQL